MITTVESKLAIKLYHYIQNKAFNGFRYNRKYSLENIRSERNRKQFLEIENRAPCILMNRISPSYCIIKTH